MPKGKKRGPENLTPSASWVRCISTKSRGRLSLLDAAREHSRTIRRMRHEGYEQRGYTEIKSTIVLRESFRTYDPDRNYNPMEDE